MATVAEMVLRIVGKDDASATLKNVSGGLDKLKTIGTVAGGAAFAAGAGFLKIGNDFDSMTDTIAAGTGATGDALDDLNKQALDVFKGMPVSMGDAGTAIADLNTRLGLTGDELEGVARDFLDFSRVSGTDVSSAVRDATRVMGDWGIAAEDSGLLLDKLFLGSQATGIGIDRLSQSVVQFGAPLRGMGFTIDESISLLGKWEKEGVNTELVLGSMRIAMGKFARDGVPMREGLDDTIAKIQELGPSAEATALAMDVFGARAGADMAAAILEGRFELGEMVATIEDAEGAVDSTAKSMDDWREKLKILKNQVVGSVAPYADLTGGILSAGGSAALMASNLGRVAPALAAIGPGITAATTAAQAMGVALLTPPLGIVVALIAVGVAAYIFRDDIIAAFKAAWEFIEPIVDDVIGALQAVLDFGREHWPEIATIISGPFALIVAPATDAFGVRTATIGAIDEMLEYSRENWPEIASILSGPFLPITALATDGWGVRTAFVGALDAMLDKAIEWGGDILTFFINLPGNILSALGDLSNTLKDAGKDLIQGFIDGMTSIPIPNPLDLVPGGGIIKTGGGVIGKGVSFATSPFRAAGGPVTAGSAYVVGEDGPELFVPGRSGAILSNDQARGGGGIVINNYGPIYPTRDAKSPRDALADVAFAAAAAMRSRGVWVPI